MSYLYANSKCHSVYATTHHSSMAMSHVILVRKQQMSQCLCYHTSFFNGNESCHTCTQTANAGTSSTVQCI